MGSTDKGWIKLHRKLLQSPIWESGEPFTKRDAWVDLLLHVVHKDTATFIGNERTTLRPGQGHTSMRALSRRWSWSLKKTRYFMGTLEAQGMVTLKGTPYGTIVTIENWALYQGSAQGKGHTQGNTKGQTRSSNKEEDAKEGSMEPQNAAPTAGEDDDEWMTLEEYQKQWEEYTDSTAKTPSASSGSIT